MPKSISYISQKQVNYDLAGGKCKPDDMLNVRSGRPSDEFCHPRAEISEQILETQVSDVMVVRRSQDEKGI